MRGTLDGVKKEIPIPDNLVTKTPLGYLNTAERDFVQYVEENKTRKGGIGQ